MHQNWRLNERMYGGLTGLNKKETVAKYGVEQVGQWRRSYDTPRTRLAARTRQSDLGAQRPTAAQLRHAACAPRRAQRRRSKRTANTGRATTTSTRTSPRLTSLSQSVSRIRCAARALGRWRRWAPGRQWWAWCVRAHPWRSRRRAQVERCLPYWETSITPALKRGKTCLIAAHGNSIRGMLKWPQLAPPPPHPPARPLRPLARRCSRGAARFTARHLLLDRPLLPSPPPRRRRRRQVPGRYLGRGDHEARDPDGHLRRLNSAAPPRTGNAPSTRLVAPPAQPGGRRLRRVEQRAAAAWPRLWTHQRSMSDAFGPPCAARRHPPRVRARQGPEAHPEPRRRRSVSRPAAPPPDQPTRRLLSACCSHLLGPRVGAGSPASSSPTPRRSRRRRRRWPTSRSCATRSEQRAVAT